MSIQEVYALIIASGRVEEALGINVRRREKQGQELVTDCPFCGKKEHLYVSAVKPVAHCFVCEWGGDWVDLLMEMNHWTFAQARDHLYAVAGVPRPSTPLPPEEEKTHRRARMLYYAHEFFKKTLFEEAGREVLEYLVNVRKYDEELIRRMELGAYVDQGALVDFLKGRGFEEDEIKPLLIKGLGTTHVLAVPWRDLSGRVVGFTFRRLNDAEPKYMNMGGFEKSKALVGIEGAHYWFSRLEKNGVVLVCEGVLDALHWNAWLMRKMENCSKEERDAMDLVWAVAVGGTSISEEQWKMIRFLRATICLAFDNDDRGQKALKEHVSKYADHGLLVAQFPSGVKDLDELLRFGEKKLVFIPAHVWFIRNETSKMDLTSAVGRQRTLDVCLKFASKTSGIVREECVREIGQIFGLSQEAVEQELRKRELIQNEILIENIKKSLWKDLEKVSDLESLYGVLQSTLGKINPRTNISPYLCEKYLADIRNVPEGMETGFKGLDKLIKIRFGTVTVVAGRPRHGKTSFMLNLLLNLLERYPERKFYFFSYELPASFVVTMLLMILSGKVLDEQHNFDAYWKYLKNMGDQGVEKIDEALAKYDEWASSGRLYIIDEPFTDKELSVVFSSIDEGGVVFVDYIQKVPTTATTSARYVEIQEVMEKLRDSATKYKHAIIVGAQTSRQAEEEEPQLHHLRESGDIEQDASIVLALYNYRYHPDREKSEKIKTLAENNMVKVLVLKNRFGSCGEYVLKFNGRTFKFEPIPEGT